MENQRTVVDGVRLAARAVVYAVVGGAALVAIGTVVSVLGPTLALDLWSPAVAAWWTVFTAVVVQAVPFLLLGTVVSAAIGAFVPETLLKRLLPARPALAVPVAGVAGVLLPGCECASVPVAGSLMRRGVAPAAALAFLLSAPAVNPVVLVATSIAFPGRPVMVLARFVASLGVALVMGWLWARFGKEEWLRLGLGLGKGRASGTTGITRAAGVLGTGEAAGSTGSTGSTGAAEATDVPCATGTTGASPKARVFLDGLQHDFLHAGGFLVLGAAAAATFGIVVPRSVLELFTGSPWLSVLLLAGLAVVLCVCSEADAFVAASLSAFPPTARLAFMVVGPMVDLKLIALQTGTFGRAFAVRFASATWVVAVAASALVGWWLL